MKKKDIIIVVVISVLVIGAGAFLFMEQRHKKMVSDFAKLSDQTTITYLAFSIYLSASITTEGLNNIYDDTRKYWQDYITCYVYGSSTYNLKSFNDVMDRLDKEYAEEYDSIKLALKTVSNVKNSLTFIDTHNNEKYASYKKTAIDFADAYINLTDAIIGINTTYNDYPRKVGDAISTYNPLSNQLDTLIKKNEKDYDKYKEFIIKNKLNKYCNTDIKKLDGYTVYQVCDKNIREHLKLEEIDY